MPTWKGHHNRSCGNSLSVHQTLVSRSLFYHARDHGTIAAVATISPIFKNSSLGPNLLALIEVDDSSMALFTKIFSPSNTLQFTNTIKIDKLTELNCSKFVSRFIHKINKSRYFSRSLKSLSISDSSAGSLLHHFKEIVSLEEVTWCVSVEVDQLRGLAALNTLPNLSSLVINEVRDSSGNSFDPSNILSWLQEFEQHASGIVNMKTLRKLNLHAMRFSWIQRALCSLLPSSVSNLFECNLIQPQWIVGTRFTNLRRLDLDFDTTTTDEHLVTIGNSCKLLDSLALKDVLQVTGSFLNSPRLEETAFEFLTSLHYTSDSEEFSLSEQAVGSGFSRLSSLQYLKLQDSFLDNRAIFGSPSLSFLPNPQLMKTVYISEVGLVNEVLHESISKMVNLEVLFLDLGGIDTFKDDGLLKLSHLQNLRELTLQSVSQIEIPIFVEILLSPSFSCQLSVLDISYCCCIKFRHAGQILGRHSKSLVRLVLGDDMGMDPAPTHDRLMKKLIDDFPEVLLYKEFKLDLEVEEEEEEAEEMLEEEEEHDHSRRRQREE